MRKMISDKFVLLKSIFGYSSFRPLQEECIEAVLNKQDTLMIMPTGGGKSLCYQIPALMFDGLTVVISPLISLMKDQVSQLRAVGVEAEVLNSSLSWEEYQRNKERVRSGCTKLLFLAPETLFKSDMLALLDECYIDCIAIDEAHCISEWGHDFRPEYRQIKSLRSRFPDAVYLAVTATATNRVQQDICTNLGQKNPVKFQASFNRENLFYEVIEKHRATDQVLDFLKKFENQSGIIYCFSRKQVDALTRDLNEFGYKALAYHAGLSPEIRQKNQELFIRDDVPIMVATIAFGMGINKPNVRFVIHHDLPKNIESYYQETGRAGRDGLPAHCLLLFSPGDSGKINYFIEQKTDEGQKRIARAHLSAMVGFAETHVCRRVPLITYFGENYPSHNCGMCDTCTNPKKSEVDLTKEAVLFFQGMSETEEMFGATHVINVLRGSKGEKVFSYGHDACQCYAKGHALSVRQWQNLVRQMLVQKVLEKEPKYGVLSLNARSDDIVSGHSFFYGYALPVEKIKSKGENRLRKTRVTGSYNSTLFDLLRIKRKELADKRGVPPYVIFSDKSLIDMCQRMPRTQNEFAEVFGVGDQKLKKFGDIFLEIINIQRP
ncbi:MAG: DNA helicase RecQ [Candidatus Omnitrophica bacterium]|nr:DNA helicase RecQ [Candidatus Omnitrophota bacterium]